MAAVSVLEPSSMGLPRQAALEIERLEKGLEASREGRRLLAETFGVERRSGRLKGEPVEFRHGPPPALVFDVDRLSSLTETEFLLLHGRELARAAVGAPPEVVEGELSARARQLRLALDLCEADPALSKRMREIAKIPPGEPEPPARRGEVGRAARGLALVAKDPGEFFDWVERDLDPSRERFALYELEDYDARHAGEAPSGRRRRRAVAEAAARLRQGGGLVRAREAVAGFDGTEAAELSLRARKWLNSSR